MRASGDTTLGAVPSNLKRRMDERPIQTKDADSESLWAAHTRPSERALELEHTPVAKQARDPWTKPQPCSPCPPPSPHRPNTASARRSHGSRRRLYAFDEVPEAATPPPGI
mmetsp:Transcript_22855/g.58784  ORF Transcript_22855/g.58784 Transcript_22855/m.58784 type:complete len:111 (-) Transcript_22855:277-609(-)